MYDELIKSLRDMSQMGMKYGIAVVEMREAADAIEELQKAVNFHKFNSEFWEDKYNSLVDEKWIPVTERLPENGVPTLICGDGNIVEQGFFDDENGYWYDWGGNRTFVHHWMPLPEPPKEET